MKLVNMILILVVIQAVIILYDQTYGDTITDDYNINAYDSNESIIWNFIVNPSDWSNTDLLGIFVGLIGITGVIGIGTFLYTKSDTVLFFSIFTILLGFGSIPILSLYNVFIRETSLFGCTSLACPQAFFVWLFTGGILSIMYILACLEWWSGRSTG